MLEFVKNAFRRFMGFILWANLAIFVIVGGVAGNVSAGGGATVVGIIVGAIVGLFINIIFGGFVANFLKLCENVEKLAGNNTSTET